jgi:DNA invertase Pin-like site-specific DNA recombinase
VGFGHLIQSAKWVQTPTRLNRSLIVSLYGYARVSPIDQDLRPQRVAPKAAGCDVIRAEKVSGSRRDGRTELQMLLDFVRPGDALIVTRIDRLVEMI